MLSRGVGAHVPIIGPTFREVTKDCIVTRYHRTPPVGYGVIQTRVGLCIFLLCHVSRKTVEKLLICASQDTGLEVLQPDGLR